MKHPSRFACCLLLATLAGFGSAAEAVGPVVAADGCADLQGFVDGALRAGRDPVVIPPGTYRVRPSNGVHLRFEEVRGATIIADGVEMVCTETTRALTIIDSVDLTIRGLTIDYDPLCYTQGRITGTGTEGTEHTIELFDGYPDASAAINKKYELFSPQSRELSAGSLYPRKVQVIDARHLRVTLPASGGAQGAIGDLAVIDAEQATGGKLPHAIVCEDSQRLRFEGVTIYGANSFAYREEGCTGNVLTGCRVDRRSAADDPVRRASPRLRSSNADGFHSAGARQGPVLTGCSVAHNGDDGIAIHGEYLLVMAAEGDRLRLLSRSRMDKAVAVGELVEIVAFGGARLPDARITAVEADAPASAEEREWIGRQRMDERLKRKLENAIRVTLDRTVAVERGAALAVRGRLGSGFRIEGCTVGMNRSRGILVKASDGRIAGNSITGCWGVGIMVSPEFWWLEAGCADRLVIEGNRFAGCRSAAIQVAARIGARETGPPGMFNDIAILGNEVEAAFLPAIRAAGVSRLRFEGNAVQAAGAPLASVRMLTVVPGETPPQAEGQVAIELLNCEPASARSGGDAP
jgi:hypothetical protein